MPRVDWNGKAAWDQYYRKGAEGLWGHPNTRPEVKLHYHKAVREVRIGQRAAALGLHFGPAAYNKRILIVGGAFGWLAEALLTEGFLTVGVTDTSSYVQAEKDNTEETELRAEITSVGLDPDTDRGALILSTHLRGPRRGSIDIIDADILTPAGRTTVRQAMGNPQVVVTETVLESLEDNEAITLSEAAHAFPGQVEVVHVVYTLAPDGGQNPVFNWKTLADWKMLIPADTFVDASTYEVIR